MAGKKAYNLSSDRWDSTESDKCSQKGWSGWKATKEGNDDHGLLTGEPTEHEKEESQSPIQAYRQATANQAIPLPDKQRSDPPAQ